MINFEEKLRNKTSANLRKVMDELNEAENFSDVPDGLRMRITNHARRLNFSPEELFEEAKKNMYLASFFASDPKRQNFYEKEVSDYLKAKVKDFKSLPISGPKAFFFGDPGIVIGEQAVSVNSSKSLDCSWVEDEHLVWATLKYIDQDGGGQDNQYHDVLKFLGKAMANRRANPEIPFIYAAVCDGDYFNRRGRMQKLVDLINVNGVVVATHDQIVERVHEEVKILTKRGFNFH